VLRPTPTKQPARDQITETNTQATNQKQKDMKKKEEKRRPTHNKKKKTNQKTQTQGFANDENVNVRLTTKYMEMTTKEDRPKKKKNNQ
jgi:hypothetical protein